MPRAGDRTGAVRDHLRLPFGPRAAHKEAAGSRRSAVPISWCRDERGGPAA